MVKGIPLVEDFLNIGDDETELLNQQLAEALLGKSKFSAEEWVVLRELPDLAECATQAITQVSSAQSSWPPVASMADWVPLTYLLISQIREAINLGRPGLLRQRLVAYVLTQSCWVKQESAVLDALLHLAWPPARCGSRRLVF